MKVLICLLASFGTVMLVLTLLAEMVRYTLKPEKDNIYKLCERYIDAFNNGDGYWVTITEIDLHNELHNRLEDMGMSVK